jgi:hypothetical protein
MHRESYQKLTSSFGVNQNTPVFENHATCFWLWLSCQVLSLWAQRGALPARANVIAESTQTAAHTKGRHRTLITKQRRATVQLLAENRTCFASATSLLILYLMVAKWARPSNQCQSTQKFC